jgi:signal transduction histidine kinase/CheY-like chemotaxis protein
MAVKLRSKTILSIIIVIMAVSGCYLYFYSDKQNENLGLVMLTVLVTASLVLYLSFNKLFSELVQLNESIKRKNEELRKSQKRLEAVVAERTRELEEANTQLNREITRRREANLSLSRSIGEWQSTFDAITDPVTILDKDLEIVIANKAAHELLNRDNDETTGRKCHELFAGSPEVCDMCPAMEIQRTGEIQEHEVDLNYLGKNLLVTCAPIHDGSECIGFVHTARDVTSEKKLKRQLAQAQKMEAIATLAGGIAHDFNNILGAILGNADLLLYRLTAMAEGEDAEGKVSISVDDIGSHLEAIKKAGNRAKELVSQILTFSRQGKSQRQNARVNPVIKEGVKLLRSSLPANIEIKTAIDPDTCQVHADLTQVHQVFMNLCTNAAQAMDEHGGRLDISLKTVDYAELDHNRYPDLKQGRYVALAVKDTGHGMTPEVMERIFDPFFTTKDVSEGTGMGLAVIHGIITAHGGELEVRSTEGVGSEFTVFLPCVDGRHDTGEDAVLGVPRGNERILFVDDEEDILRMTTRMLEYLGYTVYPATSAEQAIAMLTRESFHVDLVITDYSMPGNSGVQLAEDLLAAGVRVPVVLCSGFSDSVILDQDARRVIRKFMSKPLDMKKLAFTVREVLSTSNGVNNADSHN